MSKSELNGSHLANLRERGLLGENEIAYRAGDLVVAENPVTGDKRVLGQAATVLTESNKRVLKG